jgi:GAF domain-containing protein
VISTPNFAAVSSAANDSLPQRVEQLEHENYHLASMYVAGLQFHSARTLPEVLQTITEILLNFVGIGAFTLFVVDEERQVLFALAREGGDLEACAEVGVNDSGASVGAAGPAGPAGAGSGPIGGSGPTGGATGPIAAMIQRARPWTRGDPAYADDNAIMYLPLVSNRRLVAVLRLESFLAQKPGFDDNDFSLLSMISEHAGIAIETAWIRAHAKAVALQRQAVEQLVGA